MKKLFGIILYFLLNLSFSYALSIHEVMYNPEGSDVNREWVEIYNDESSSVDISTWHFFENDTHHGLFPNDFTHLGVGERALIVKNPSDIQSELGSNIKYIKASFSLNNTGETIGLSDGDKNIIDSFSYSVDDGANGDGKSLQLISSTWKVSAPTPGAVNEISSESSDVQSSNNIEEDDEEEKVVAKKIFKPHYFAEIKIPNVVVAQNSFTLEVSAKYMKKEGDSRDRNGYYYINFGNGDSLESYENINIPYTYRHGGNYIIVFEYYSSKLAYESGAEADIFIKRNISVTEHELEILDVNSFDGVVLKNNTNKTINTHGWKIVWGDRKYSFPEYSFISSGNTIHILFDTLGFYPKPSREYPIQLLSNIYKPISIFPQSNNVVLIKNVKKVKHTKKVRNISKKNESEKEEDKILIFDDLPDVQGGFFGESTHSYLDDYLAKNPNKLKVNFNKEVKNEKEKKRENARNSLYYTLGSFLLMLGAGRLIKRRNKVDKIDKKDDFGSIEILE